MHDIALIILSAFLGALIVRQTVLKRLETIEHELNEKRTYNKNQTSDFTQNWKLFDLRWNVLFYAFLTGLQLGLSCISSYYRNKIGLLLATIYCLLYLKKLCTAFKIYYNALA